MKIFFVSALVLLAFLNGCVEPNSYMILKKDSNFFDVNGLVRVSSGDASPDFLFSKLVGGTNIVLTKNNPGANETITIAASGGPVSDANKAGVFDANVIADWNKSSSLKQRVIADANNPSWLLYSVIANPPVIPSYSDFWTSNTNQTFLDKDKNGTYSLYTTKVIQAKEMLISDKFQCTTCQASGANSSAFGQTTTASGDASVAFGQVNKEYSDGKAASIISSGRGSFAGGYAHNYGSCENDCYSGEILASGNGSFAFGLADGEIDEVDKLVSAAGIGSFAVGSNTKALSDYSIAIGKDALANNQFGIAVGQGATASASDSMAIGSNTVANGVGCVAIGYGSQCNGALSYSIGFVSKAQTQGAVAIGEESLAAELRSIAIGFNSKALQPNSIAIGTNAVSAKPNLVTLATDVNIAGYATIGAGKDMNIGLNAGDVNAGGKMIAVGIKSTMGYDINGTKGLTKTLFVMNAAIPSIMCYIDVNGGIITASNC